MTMDRRTYLATAGTVGLGAVAGCASRVGSNGGSTPSFDPTVTSKGQSNGDPEAAGGPPSMTDLPPLSGELTIYLGRGEGGLYGELLDYFQHKLYEDLTLSVRRDSSSSLANTIVEEESHDASPADVFWSIDAGSLGAIATRGLARTLPTDLTGLVPPQFSDDQRRWVGISGRARAIPYNTDQFSEAEIPTDIFAFPDRPAFDGTMGWAPTYGAYQAFVTAMRLDAGEQATRDWLSGMLDSGVQSYGGEFLVTNAVANGELGAGFANHYYALRLKAAKPDAPLGLAFTKNDAGALVNASGALVLESSERAEMATTFVRHLLTREVQDFLARKAFEYPLVAGIDPPGSLPPIDELDPPKIDLTRLANVKATLQLLRDEGVL